MKKADLTKCITDGVTVAVDRWYSPAGYYPPNAREATVIAVGQTRRSSNGKYTNDGVRIRPIEGADPYFGHAPIIKKGSSWTGVGTEYEDTADRIVSSAKVIAPYADYVARLRELTVATQVAQERKNANSQRHNAVVAALADHGVHASPYWPHGASGPRGVVISVALAEQLAEQLTELAREQAELDKGLDELIKEEAK